MKRITDFFRRTKKPFIPTGPNHFQNTPDDIIKDIISYLPVSDLQSVKKVDCRFKSLGTQEFNKRIANEKFKILSNINYEISGEGEKNFLLKIIREHSQAWLDNEKIDNGRRLQQHAILCLQLFKIIVFVQSQYPSAHLEKEMVSTNHLVTAGNTSMYNYAMTDLHYTKKINQDDVFKFTNEFQQCKEIQDYITFITTLTNVMAQALNYNNQRTRWFFCENKAIDQSAASIGLVFQQLKQQLTETEGAMQQIVDDEREKVRVRP